MQRTWLKHFVASLAVLACSLNAWADPPGRVGRFTLIEGNVRFYADQEEGWQSARLNLPVTSENSLWTDPGARAEVRVGASALRLDGDSVLDIQKLDDRETLLYLQRGTANIRVGLIEKQDQYRITTPEGAIILGARGSYRIDADIDKGETRIAVLSGRARLESPAGRRWIEAGRMGLIEARSVRAEPLALTEFDDWVQARDERWDPEHAIHVSPHMTGHEDLDEHGNWIEEAEYGRVWVPRVVIDDWAPYRYGHWRYLRPWGWTWIDDAPWGFAPSHYGRWVHLRGRWAWWPGDHRYRPIYSPALVAWVGGSGWNVNFSSGSGLGIGWFPLAPYEPFVPWYVHSPAYVYNINHIHRNRPVQTRPPRQYANHKPGVTVVSPTTFQSAAHVARNQARISGESVWSQPVVQNGSLLPPRWGDGRRRTEPGSGSEQRPGGNPAGSKPLPSVGVPESRPLGRNEIRDRENKPPVPNQVLPKPMGRDTPPTLEPGPESMPSRATPSRQPELRRGRDREQTEPAPSFRTPAPVPSTRVPAPQPALRETRPLTRENSRDSVRDSTPIIRTEKPRPAEVQSSKPQVIAPAPQPAAPKPQVERKESKESTPGERVRQNPRTAEQ